MNSDRTTERQESDNAPLRQSILILDSNPSAALVTQRGLQMLLGDSADVQMVHTVQAGLTACRNGAVALVIVDPHPRSNAAIDFIRQLNEEQSAVGILVLTAYDTPRLRAQMRELGVKGYLAKPVDLVDLHRLVSQLLTNRTIESSP